MEPKHSLPGMPVSMIARRHHPQGGSYHARASAGNAGLTASLYCARHIICLACCDVLCGDGLSHGHQLTLRLHLPDRQLLGECGAFEAGCSEIWAEAKH